MKLFFFLTYSNERDNIIAGSNEPVNKKFKKKVEKLKVSKKKLEIAMARAKLNRNELAEKANMPVSTICNVYSRGTCKPGTAGRLAEALGCDVTEIIED